MRLAGVPRYTAGELERRAEDLLRSRCGWPPPIPVDIDLLVDQEPGVLLDILPGLQRLYGVAGLVRYEPVGDRLRIIIDAEVADHPSASFYRFTVAEEFAHILLHRAIMVQVRNDADLADLHAWSGYADIDRNAKRLAAALLMPAVTVSAEARDLYTQLVRAVGFRDPQVLQAHLAGRLARRYRVSAEAMRHRLREWPLRITEKVERAMRSRLEFLA